MNKVTIIKYSVAACAFLVAGGLYYSASIAHADEESVTYYDATVESTDDKDYYEETSEQSIYVYICGSINEPGVYLVSAGTRIYKVIEMAGGLSEEAEAGGINQAETVCDGDMVYIPAIGENTISSSTDDEESALVNINTADQDKLMTLPGIGEARATAIIEYREQSGDFATIEDIMNVSGIKEAAYSKIEDYICVE